MSKHSGYTITIQDSHQAVRLTNAQEFKFKVNKRLGGSWVRRITGIL